VADRPTIFKFGGTSLQSADRFRSAAEQAAQFEGPLVVVTSALGGITNRLVDSCDNPAAVPSVREELSVRHLQMAVELGLPDAAIDGYREYLASTLDDLTKAGQLSGGERADLILSVGERLSTQLMALTLAGMDRPAVYVDSRTILRTDSRWGEARVDLEQTAHLVKAALKSMLAEGSLPVVTGFLGCDEIGKTTTIGRNGSDLSATVLGACLEADEVWIWTDVDGILTADPRYHNNSRLLPEISFREAAEVAYFGATVIHPHTLWPLLESTVSVRIKNSLDPAKPGTLICTNPERRGTTLITTSIEGVAMITVGGYGMVGLPGVAATIFSAVRDTHTNVLMISQSSAEHNITFVIMEEEVEATVASLHDALADWLDGDHRIDHIRITSDVGVISVVGDNMRHRSGIAGKIFSALGTRDINVIAIAQGSSEYSISMVLEKKELHRAVDAIHGELDEELNGR
jgi:aspartate kinase